MMTRIEKLRSAKPDPIWVSWAWLAGACLWLISLTINLFADKPGPAVTKAVCFSVCMLNYYTISQNRMNRDLLHEIDALRKQLAQNPTDNNSKPPSTGDAANRAAPEK